MRIRIKERCFVGGSIRYPGEIVILPDGMKGPYRAVQKAHDKIDYGTNPPVDANRILGEVEDVPLFEEIDDQPETHSEPDKKEAEAASKHRADSVARPAEKPAEQSIPFVEPQAPVLQRTHVEEREKW